MCNPNVQDEAMCNREKRITKLCASYVHQLNPSQYSLKQSEDMYNGEKKKSQVVCNLKLCPGHVHQT